MVSVAATGKTIVEKGAVESKGQKVNYYEEYKESFHYLSALDNDKASSGGTDEANFGTEGDSVQGEQITLNNEQSDNTNNIDNLPGDKEGEEGNPSQNENKENNEEEPEDNENPTDPTNNDEGEGSGEEPTSEEPSTTTEEPTTTVEEPTTTIAPTSTEEATTKEEETTTTVAPTTTEEQSTTSNKATKSDIVEEEAGSKEATESDATETVDDTEKPATESETTNADDTATESETTKKVEEISTISDADKSIIIATYTVSKWKIKKVLLPKDSEGYSKHGEKDDDRIKRMASHSNVLIVDQYGHEKIINVPITWKVKETREVPKENRFFKDGFADKEQLKSQFNIERIVGKDVLSYESTSSEVMFKERVTNEQKELDDNVKVVFKEVKDDTKEDSNENTQDNDATDKTKEEIEPSAEVEENGIEGFTNTEEYSEEIVVLTEVDNESKTNKDDNKEQLDPLFTDKEVDSQTTDALPNPYEIDRNDQVNNYEISNVAVYEIDTNALADSVVKVLDKEVATGIVNTSTIATNKEKEEEVKEINLDEEEPEEDKGFFNVKALFGIGKEDDQDEEDIEDVIQDNTTNVSIMTEQEMLNESVEKKNVFLAGNPNTVIVLDEDLKVERDLQDDNNKTKSPGISIKVDLDNDEDVVPQVTIFGLEPADVSNHDTVGHTICGQTLVNCNAEHDGLNHKFIAAGQWTGITNNDSMWGTKPPDNDTYTEYQQFVNIFSTDINSSQKLNWYLKSHSATGKSTFDLYNIINIRMAIPAYVGYGADSSRAMFPTVNFQTDKMRALISRETGKIAPEEAGAYTNADELPTLNICLNGNTLNFGYGGQIRGVGRINICDCGKPSGHHDPGSITSENTGIIEKRVGSGTLGTVSWTGRRLPCIFTTGLGLYNIGSIDGIINNTDYGTGNAGPALSEGAAFYGYFKPTNANRQNRPITGISEDEIFYLNDSSSNEIGLYYYVEMDTVIFTNIKSLSGSGSCINLGITSELWLKNCTFENCESSNSGGAVCADANYFNIEDCSFTKCKAGGDGGALFTNSYEKLYARSFESNGYTWSRTSDLAQYNNLYNTRFFNNESQGKASMVRGSTDHVGGKGGGLAVYGVNYLTRFDSIIARNNYANLSGGFMYWEDSITDPSREKTLFKNIVCGNNCTEDGQVDEQHYDNYAGFSGGTFCFSSQGRGTGSIDVTIAGNNYGRSSICGSRVLGYVPSMILPAFMPDGVTPVVEPTSCGTFIPVYTKTYDPVLEDDYYLSSFGGAIFAEGVRLTLGNDQLNGNTIIQGCYANDGGAIYAQEPRSAYFQHTVSTYSIADNCKVAQVTYNHYEYDWNMVGSGRYTDNDKVVMGMTSDGWNKYYYDGVEYDNNTNYALDPVPAYVQRGEQLPTGASYIFEYKECVVDSDYCRFDTCGTENGNTDRQEVLNKGKDASEKITGFNRVNTQIAKDILYRKDGTVKYRAGDPNTILIWGLHHQVENQDDHFPYPEWMLTTSSTLEELAGEYRTNMPYVNTNRNYLSGYSGGCITVGYLAQVSVRTNTEIINCQSAMYVQGGTIEFIDIQQESLARNGGEYLFGYPSYIPGENVRDTNPIGSKDRTWHNITFNGNRELVNGCYLTGCDFVEKTYVLTTHASNLGDQFKPCRLIIKGKVKINGNRFIDPITGNIEERDVFADPTTLRIVLDRYTDKDTAISIYPSFNTEESRKATTIISNWKPYSATDTDGFEYYDGMIPNNIFVIDNKDKEGYNDLRIFRNNEYIYVGSEWDAIEIDVSILQTLDPAGGHQAKEEQYIYNIAESKVQRPSFIYGWDDVQNTYIEKTGDNDIIAGYTYVGFVGRNEIDRDADRMYKTWDFATDVFRGSKYVDSVTSIGSENMSFNRKLSLVMVDCESAGKQYKSCGCANGFDCEHDNENLKHWTIRGGYANRYAAARNVVCVTSFSQLFWQSEGKNTQYRLYKDISIQTDYTSNDSALNGVEISASLKGPYIIYMDGYDITLTNPRYGLFDASAANFINSKLAWPEAKTEPDSIYDEPQEADIDRCQWVYLVGTDLDGSRQGEKSYIHCATNSVAPFIEINGRDMFLKDVTVDGYETPNTSTLIQNGDKNFISDIARIEATVQYIESGRGLSVENATFSNIKTYYNDMIVAANLWFNKVNIVNCEATAEKTGNTNDLYFDIIRKLTPTTTDVLNHSKYYQVFNNVNITNCSAKGAFNETFDSAKEMGAITAGSVLFNNVNVKNNNFYKYIFNSMITIANATYVSPTFDGNNYFTDNTIGKITHNEQNLYAFRFNRDEIDKNPTVEDDCNFNNGSYMAMFKPHSNTYINNNTIISNDPISGQLARAAMYVPGGAVDIWGHLEVANNKFTNIKTTTLANDMYEKYVTCGIEMASKRTQFMMGTGSIVCENNNGYLSADGSGSAMDPTASWTMQMFIKNKSDERKNLPIFKQKHATKIVASESSCYVHANYTGVPADSKYYIYEGWYETEVQGYNTVERAMLSHTIMIDPAINVNASSQDMRRIYAAGMNESCMVCLGADFITVKFAKFDEARANVTVESKLTQYIGVETDASGNKRAIQTNLEMAVEDLGDGFFWVGPTQDFNEVGSLGYHKYVVYKQNFIPQYTNMTEDYVVYGFHSDKHSHPAALDLLDEPVDYWVEAGNAASTYESTDYLNRNYHCMTDASHLQSDHAKIYLSTDITFDIPRISTLSNGYSICLNGHNLTIDKQTFIDIKTAGVNVYITDCKRTGKIIFNQGDSATEYR